jgi:hypothetical protein
MRPQSSISKGNVGKGLRQTQGDVAHHLPTDVCKTDDDLAAVVAAWPELPEAVRQSILMLAKVGSGESGGR